MADKKISELTAITGADTAATDAFVMVDTSTGETKKITREELNNAIEQDVLSNIDIDTINGDFSVNGNMAITGTVDGRDVAADGTKLDGIEASATADQTGAEIATALNGETISSLTALTTTGAVIVGGDLTVNGTTTTINSTTLTVDDKNIELASGAADAAAANGAGITIDGASATFNYASTGDKWTFNKPIDVAGNIIVSGTVDGRDVAADGTKLDGIETGATADQTAAEIRTLVESATDSNVFTDADHTKLNGIETGATADQTKSDIDALGIDAATLDGIDSASFLRSDADDAMSGNLTVSGGLNNDPSGGGKFRTYSMGSTSGGGDWLLGKIEHNSSQDGAVDGKVYFAYDYGSTNDSATIHFSFHQRSGTARGHWWYEHDDDDSAADLVRVVLIDDGSGGMFVWVRAADYCQVQAEAVWRQCSSVTDSGTLSSGTITSGTSLFDTSNDPTSEHHVGNLFAHGTLYAVGNSQQHAIGTTISYVSSATGTVGMKFYNNTLWQVSPYDSAVQRVDARDDATNFARMHWYGQSDSGATSNFRHAYYTGSNYVNVTAQSSNDLLFGGDILATGNITAYSSDERLKENIQTIEGGLDKVCQLRGVTFDWRDDCEEKGFVPEMKSETGFIAQEVQKVIPDAVVPAPFDSIEGQESGEDYLTVNPQKVIPVLVEAIKELKAEIEELKNASAE